MSRLGDLERFYDLLDYLESKVGPKRLLANCNGTNEWPKRGVYFIFEPGEERSESGAGQRVVRVGTHALTANSRTSLWNRLSQHRGVSSTGLGNHRGSIFRLLVGTALNSREGRTEPESWGIGSTPGQTAALLGLSSAAVRARETPLEAAVTDYIGRMSVLWLPILDPPGTDSDRGIVERNSIALLSNFHEGPALDLHSDAWVGQYCKRNVVRLAGLWNVNHVEQTYDASFLDTLENYARHAGSAATAIR